MSEVGERERRTQQRVVKFFQSAMGYTYLGDWMDRPDNSNVEEALLTDWLKRQGHDDEIISKTLFYLDKITVIASGKTLYDTNREVYGLLRYGVKVRPGVGEQTITVPLINWKHPEKNDFAIAEEVAVSGKNNKRPDIVLYVNGIALGVLELKRSIVSVAEGIRQNLSNQKKEFIQPFFTTVQLVMAGNETEGLRYGVIETPEKYWLKWKEADTHPAASDNLLLRELGQLCRKQRLLEIVHDFMVFDAGIKKTCRHNQYFGVQAAQARVEKREGGILWHTQGSGKSLIMVWLAKWIYENVSNSRVLIVTDRTELDEQIERVFKGVREDIYRTKSGADLVHVLNANEEWLVGSLIHKFGVSEEVGEKDIESYVAEIQENLPKGFHAKGEMFVFVDECHRTQSGKLHRALQGLLPHAMLIGFTGTPLLKNDKKSSIETFGPYIHTYKYDEAIGDDVVLDLHYEARNIDQYITSPEKVDQWFETKTQGLTDMAKAQVRRRWGTMQEVRSSHNRLKMIVADIMMDMATHPRLMSGHGNAMLVSDSIHSACRFFEMFQNTNLVDKCAVVTSYRPSPSDISGEETGEGVTERLRQHETYRKMLAAYFNEPADTAMYKVEQFEKEVKKRFIEEPGKMKLLIVVDKLLTGFDAPPATCLYIDKPMQDHGLFQAICRVNRLDGEDKKYGHIIDYMDLFQSLGQAITDYTGEAFEGYEKADVEGLLKNRLQKGREQLDRTREEIKALCEPVDQPRDTPAYLRYFCSVESGNAEQIKANESKRVTLYKLAGAFLRSYANLANEMADAGYSGTETWAIKAEVHHYEKVREEVKLASGDYVDMKLYEPDMRLMLDTYIHAEESERLSAFDNDMTLVQLIVERGEDALNKLPQGIRQNKDAMAETIENNVRRLIINEMAVNPRYYEKMSELLDALIEQRKQDAIDYKAYLEKIIELTKKVSKPEATSLYPPTIIDNQARRALYDNLKDVSGLSELLQVQEPDMDTSEDVAAIAAQEVDAAIRGAMYADWRGNKLKERVVRNAIGEVLGDEALVKQIFEIAKAQRDY